MCRFMRSLGLLVVLGTTIAVFVSLFVKDDIKDESRDNGVAVEKWNEVEKELSFLPHINTYCQKWDPMDLPPRYKNATKFVRSDRRLFIAINLYNNQEILPDMIRNLLRFLSLFHPSDVFVSIYENGSTDNTKLYLHIFDSLLSSLSIPHLISMSDAKKDPSIHRITYLSSTRNAALHPLFTTPTHFTTILFLNDIFFCPFDLLELLTQFHVQSSHLVCGLDFDTDSHGVGFYDTWVARDQHGRMFRKRPLEKLVSDREGRGKLRHHLPFQVFCCWNGMAVLDARVFQEGIKFRKSETMGKSEGSVEYEVVKRRHPGRTVYETCSGSEMSVLCQDMHKAGFRKAVVVPSVKVAYDIGTYKNVMMDRVPVEEYEVDEERERVRYRRDPVSTECHPLENIGLRSPDGVLGELVVQ